MSSTPPSALPTLDEAARFSPRQIVELAVDRAALEREVGQLQQKIVGFQHQLDWFRRQIFGQKSEKRGHVAPGQQMNLGELLTLPQTATPPEFPTSPVTAHTRHKLPKSPDAGAESLRFFDETRVPVEVIELPNPEIDGLTSEQFEVIGSKETFRLAQRPGSYVVIKYVRPVVKLLATQVISCPRAPVGVLDGSRADVSFLVGLLLDKFAYHLPLYRQHQRLLDAGFTVSRPWLTQLAQQGAALLEPIYDALLVSIRSSRVIAMDETPIKAGQGAPGKMKQGYFWPIFGEQNEVAFPFFESRRHEHVKQALGVLDAGKVLLSDGYDAYSAYAKVTGLILAQCWSHTRRNFFDAQKADPKVAGEALDQIGALYAIEEHIRDKRLKGDKKRDYRLNHAKPLVEKFFAWVARQFETLGLAPTNPLTGALAYAKNRRFGLEVFLTDPDVPIDTNHLERALRPIPMGRRAWLFCWTELGAKHVGILQSLIVTCRLHDVDPYDYLVDVLQRIATHPAADVHLLTPRCWKPLFAANPLRSDLYSIRK